MIALCGLALVPLRTLPVADKEDYQKVSAILEIYLENSTYLQQLTISNSAPPELLQEIATRNFIDGMKRLWKSRQHTMHQLLIGASVIRFVEYERACKELSVRDKT